MLVPSGNGFIFFDSVEVGLENSSTKRVQKPELAPAVGKLRLAALGSPGWPTSSSISARRDLKLSRARSRHHRPPRPRAPVPAPPLPGHHAPSPACRIPAGAAGTAKPLVERPIDARASLKSTWCVKSSARPAAQLGAAMAARCARVRSRARMSAACAVRVSVLARRGPGLDAHVLVRASERRNVGPGVREGILFAGHDGEQPSGPAG